MGESWVYRPRPPSPWYVALAERWNGTKWTILPTPNPSGTTRAVLNAVSCASARDCMAVGVFYRQGTQVTLAEHWSGRRWTILATPNPTQPANSELRAVSCTSASACTAVGDSFSQDRTVVLAERWNGRSWTIETAPNPSGTSYPVLSGVSCASARACMAVGEFNGRSLAERWNGSVWTILPTPPNRGQVLRAVSCTSASACTAVGDSGGGVATLAERWNGTTWRIQPTRSPTDRSSLWAVSCSSGHACTAVGYDEKGSLPQSSKALPERWNGSSWTRQQTPDLGRPAALYGVSCTSTSKCTAVGRHENGGAGPLEIKTLAESWNGA